MVQIYTDEETSELMTQLKKENPSLVFSKIFKEALKREISGNRIEQSRLMKLSYMLDEARFKEEQAKDKTKRILDEISKEQDKNKKDLKEVQDKAQVKQTKEEQRFESIYNNILEFYPEIKDISLINQLTEEWIRVFETCRFNSLFEFMESKGYKSES